jgi:hypothetical protein
MRWDELNRCQLFALYLSHRASPWFQERYSHSPNSLLSVDVSIVRVEYRLWRSTSTVFAQGSTTRCRSK